VIPRKTTPAEKRKEMRKESKTNREDKNKERRR
jgi:hypothetical protein